MIVGYSTLVVRIIYAWDSTITNRAFDSTKNIVQQTFSVSTNITVYLPVTISNVPFSKVGRILTHWSISNPAGFTSSGPFFLPVSTFWTMYHSMTSWSVSCSYDVIISLSPCFLYRFVFFHLATKKCSSDRGCKYMSYAEEGPVWQGRNIQFCKRCCVVFYVLAVWSSNQIFCRPTGN